MTLDDTPYASPRLALVGAHSLLGKEIKERLAETGFPGTDLALFDLDDVAGLLTDYGTEARVLAEAVEEQVLDYELVCFCGDRATALDYLPRVRAAGRRGLDCTGAWLDDGDVFAWIPGVSDPPVISDNPLIAIPSAASLMLAHTMAGLGELGAGASANIFVPASELGDAGLQELSQQSTAVMNLLEINDDLFGRQMAFDIWLTSAGGPQGPDAVSATLRRLGILAPAINVVTTPVFHGMALSAFVRGSADDVSEALANAGFHLTEAEGTHPAPGDSVSDITVDEDVESSPDGPGDAPTIIDSPLRVAGLTGIHTTEVRADAEGSWIWANVDNLRLRASAAVAAILALSGNPVSDALQ